MTLQVSSHLLIRRDGEYVQYVPFHLRAWHAGASSYCGRERCNDFSIGIEMEGSDELAYEPAQYRALSTAVHALCRAYPSLSPERIAGHDEVAPGRKTDPGPAFDWPRCARCCGWREDEICAGSLFSDDRRHGTRRRASANRQSRSAPHRARVHCAPAIASSPPSNTAIIRMQRASIPRIGDAFRVDLERLLALRPDVVLVWDSALRRRLSSAYAR